MFHRKIKLVSFPKKKVCEPWNVVQGSNFQAYCKILDIYVDNEIKLIKGCKAFSSSIPYEYGKHCIFYSCAKYVKYVLQENKVCIDSGNFFIQATKCTLPSIFKRIVSKILSIKTLLFFCLDTWFSEDDTNFIFL